MATLSIKKGLASGKIEIPASKSYTHRALIMSALANGDSIINNISICQDTLATIDCLEKLGAKIILNGSTATVSPIDKTAIKSITLDCKESGSTLRFLIAIALTFDKEIRFIGSKTLISRPMNVYEALSKKCGFYFAKSEDEIIVKGPIKAGRYIVSAEISSQFVSGLLMALSTFEGESIIDIDGEINSKSYIDITLDVMKKFGVECEFSNGYRYHILPNQMINSTNFTVESDMSSASYFSALNLFGSTVEISNLNYNSLQGDKIFGEYFGQMAFSNPTLDISNCPDLAPILMAVGAAKHGVTLIGTSRLKYKESDRIFAITEELKKFSISSEIEENSVRIIPQKIISPTEIINPHNDHRIAMALSILLTLVGGEIKDFECVNKSFPDFYKLLSSIGIEITQKGDIL